MRLSLSLLLSLSLFACGEDTKTLDPLTIDDDGDGFSESQGDCDDANAEIGPHMTEICDQIDNDCDGAIDDDDSNLDLESQVFYFADVDGDGYGDQSTGVRACIVPDDYITDFSDCDDTNADIHPSAQEVCDEIDNDCDELIDDADDSTDWTTGVVAYADTDQDGEGDPNAEVTTCFLDDGFVENNTDCDDTNSALNTADIDGDGITSCGDVANNIRDCDDTDANIGTVDNDGDGFVACIDDCDDDDAQTAPGLGFNEADPTVCVRDADGDGYGDSHPDVATVTAGTDCNDNSDTINDGDADGDGISSCGGDCDDNDAAVGIVDIDGDGFSACIQDCWDSDIDEDGDGIPDSAAVYPGAAANEPELCTADQDGDGYGDALPEDSFGISSCFMLGLVDTGSYWDNAAITIFVDGAEAYSITNTSASGTNQQEQFEICEEGTVSFSYECTSSYDCSAHTFYAYIDTNGNGDYSDETPFLSDGKEITGLAPTNGVLYEPPGMIMAGSDCDDQDAATIGDADGDGFTFCTLDCDDSDASINPDATDSWYDGVDTNCDGLSDFDADMDGEDINEYDCDGDGTPETECDFDNDGTPDWIAGADCDDTDDSTVGDDDGDGFSVCVDDCDDQDDAVHPDAEEVFYDGVDQNCDGASDFDMDGDGDDISGYDFDGDGTLEESYDFDGDGVDDWVAGADCDDEDTNVHSLDIDGDGFTICEDNNGLSDCDDEDGFTFPGAGFNEAGYDSSDFSTYECLTDADGDGYGFGSTFTCFTLEMTDLVGDSWNGNAIEVYEDGAFVSTYTNTVQDGTYGDGAETVVASYCPTANTTTVEFLFVDGFYNEDVEFALYANNGSNDFLIADGYGDSSWGNAEFYFNGAGFSDGEVFYSTEAPLLYGGTDSDDGDSTTH